jgi:hypothetical protein
MDCEAGNSDWSPDRDQTGFATIELVVSRPRFDHKQSTHLAPYYPAREDFGGCKLSAKAPCHAVREAARLYQTVFTELTCAGVYGVFSFWPEESPEFPDGNELRAEIPSLDFANREPALD